MHRSQWNLAGVWTLKRTEGCASRTKKASHSLAGVDAGNHACHRYYGSNGDSVQLGLKATRCGLSTQFIANSCRIELGSQECRTIVLNCFTEFRIRHACLSSQTSENSTLLYSKGNEQLRTILRTIVLHWCKTRSRFGLRLFELATQTLTL